ncbi:hypothetical protein BDV95DRAFT_631304 [Massariosphaeria phaeospora]|uniref:Pyridoxamine 5'-phosphate oxidase N-terminal domain-containing protein n=1 Tax=Massariosphaeria phaeospora TaxID=100035 RepID=A0A7C8I3H5_9PLEO|nr:hypothetical protein BDV95DRAFT_631304 [Massariosphaeria phaeospora]
MASGSPATTSPSASHGLPDEVVTCLQNARFLHLATSSSNTPHVSLMNYTYLPSTPYTPTTPTIIMTTPPSSRKTANLATNPLVSLLVHDWVSHRPPTLSQTQSTTNANRSPSPSPARPTPRSGSLAELLLGMNTASLSRISATINGEASLVAAGSEQERWYKAQHLANNTFEASGSGGSGGGGGGGGLWGGGGLERHDDEDTREGDGGTKCYVEGEEVRVVVVKIRDGRIADWKGQVRDWVIREPQGGAVAVNGVR